MSLIINVGESSDFRYLVLSFYDWVKLKVNTQGATKRRGFIIKYTKIFFGINETWFKSTWESHIWFKILNWSKQLRLTYYFESANLDNITEKERKTRNKPYTNSSENVGIAVKASYLRKGLCPTTEEVEDCWYETGTRQGIRCDRFYFLKISLPYTRE